MIHESFSHFTKTSFMKHVAELRDLYNKIENSVTSLKDCDVPTDTYGNLLIGVVFERILQELKVISRSCLEFRTFIRVL